VPEPTLLTLYGYIGVMLAVAVVFAAVPMVIARFVRPSRPNPVKLSTYECGMETIGPTWIQYHVGFYIYALVFVIFDVETVFLYPWALAYGRLGLFALVEMLLFIAILAVGLVYALRKRVLRWW
jgi:NADH:ubiquinone oxidoreductase subunit 3 (subunit A)